MLTIAVIDEDSAIRTLFGEWLETEGYRVRSRPAPVDRLEADVDLVVLDLVNLPGEGLERVREARRAYPRATLVGTSTQLTRSLPGHSTHALALGVARLVTKPCSREELLLTVVDAIGPAA